MKKGYFNTKAKGQSLSDRVVEYVLTRTVDELAALTVEGVAGGSAADVCDIEVGSVDRRLSPELYAPQAKGGD